MAERCVKCNRAATYVAPDSYCDEHWLAWWNEGLSEDEAFDDPKEVGCPISYQRFDDHVKDCEVCCSPENGFNYCTVGQSLEESWAETIEED